MFLTFLDNFFSLQFHEVKHHLVVFVFLVASKGDNIVANMLDYKLEVCTSGYNHPSFVEPLQALQVVLE